MGCENVILPGKAETADSGWYNGSSSAIKSGLISMNGFRINNNILLRNCSLAVQNIDHLNEEVTLISDNMIVSQNFRNIPG